MNLSLALVTVVYNNYAVLDDFFVSLNAQSTKNFRVYVIDLSSKPQDYSYPEYTVHLRSENKGYAHGANVGIARALKDGYTMFAVINSDVLVAPDLVAKTIASVARHPGCVLGGKIYYAPGFEFHKDRYENHDRGKVIWFAGGSIDWANMITSHDGVDEVDVGDYEDERKTDFITGCFMAYDISVYKKVGEWDERYFLYYEDTDFSMRANRAGCPLVYDPSLVLWHKNAQSTDGSGSGIHMKYQERNRLRFGLAYAPWRTKLHLVKNAALAAVSHR
jgi:GT2 family glycosyltransferase